MLNSDHRNVYRVASATQIGEQLNRCIDYALKGADFQELVDLSDGSFRDPPGGNSVPRGRLREIREEVLAWEKSLLGRSQKVNEELRDRELASLLYDRLAVLPAQAGDPDFWSTLSTFVFPDVISRRWDLDSRDRVRLRFLNHRRGAIKRLWLRRSAISEALEIEFERILNQDYVQQIVERPSIASDVRMVEACLQVSREARKVRDCGREFDRNVVKEATLFYGVAIPQLVDIKDMYSRLWESSIRFVEPEPK